MSCANCHNCRFAIVKGYTHHVGCSNPMNGTDNDGLRVLVSLALPDKSAAFMGLNVNAHGYRNGWAFYPHEYDPIWLEGDCKGFERKVENAEGKKA